MVIRVLNRALVLLFVSIIGATVVFAQPTQQPPGGGGSAITVSDTTVGITGGRRIQISGGNPTDGTVLTATNTDGLAEWREIEGLLPSVIQGATIYGGTNALGAPAWVSTTNLFHNNTNVGIGDDFVDNVREPAAKLEIKGINPHLRLRSAATDAATAIPYIEYGFSPTVGGWTSLAKLGFPNANTFDFHIKNEQPGGGDIILEPSGTGGVGIGTATAGSKLQVNGNAAIGYSASTAAPANSLVVSGNVGIGTTSPQRQLHVNGAGTDSQIKISNANTGSASGDGFDVQVDSNQDVYLWQRENHHIYLGTNATTAMTILNSGNVGIGTVTPGSKLDVNGDITLNANAQYYRAKNSAGASTRILGINGVNDVYIGSVDADISALHIQDNGVDRVTIDSTGNVGIGITTPGTYKLNVAGNTNITGNLDVSGTITGNVETTSELVAAQVSGGTFGSAYPSSSVNYTFRKTGLTTGWAIIDGANERVGIGTTSPGTKLHIQDGVNTAFRFNGSTSTSGYTTDFVMDNTGLSIGHNSGSRDFRFRTNSLDRLTIAAGGNVGIGTTSPGNPLTVKGMSRIEPTGTTNPIDYRWTVTGPTADYDTLYLVGESSTGGENFGVGNGDGNQIVSFKAKGENEVGIGYDAGVTSHTAKLSVNGNVGIGTTAPGSKLSFGTFYDTGGTNPTAHIRLYESGTTVYGFGVQSGELNINANQSGGDIIFNAGSTNDAPSERMRIDGSGNIGIGTASPGANLEVADRGISDDAQPKLKVGNGAAGNATVNIIVNDSTNAFQVFDDNNLTTPRFLIQRSGNVGIGTASPTTKLEVIGNVNIPINAIQFNAGTNSGTAGIGSTDDGLIYGEHNLNTEDSRLVIQVRDNTNDAIVLRTSASATGANVDMISVANNVLLVPTFGSVGIATTTPGVYKLNVNGNTNITGDLDVSGTITGNVETTSAIAAGQITPGTFGSTTTKGSYRFDAAASTSPVLYVDATNQRVGVGTVSPSYPLDVIGDIRGSGNLRLIGSNPLLFETYGGGWYMSDTTWIRSYGSKNIYHNAGIMRTDGTLEVGSGGATLSVASGGNFAYRTNVLFANTSGNVGIGTTSPGSKLDVSGRMRLLQGSAGLAYNQAPLEVIQDWNAGAGDAPRISFHYSGAVASQFGYVDGDNSGDLAVIDNPGTGYETLRVRDLKVGTTQFIDSSRNIVNGGSGTFSGNLTIGTDINSTNDKIGFHSARADDTTYEWLGFYSGATRQGIMLYDGAWTSCTNVTDEFCIKAENGNHLSLYSAGGVGDHIRLMPGSGNVGIGTASPAVKLHVAGEGRFDGNLNMNNNNILGVNKITVATIDPVYNIGGEDYATYAPFMAGSTKEEVVDTAHLAGNEYIIDFDNLKRGSNLWVFYQITNFGADMEGLQVFLTPGFDGRVWYTKDTIANTLTIHGSGEGEVSYRLVADRAITDDEVGEHIKEGAININEKL
ncbi:MAG: hypothetical protein HYS87_03495 [Candidatus Colwellbacteria bacterium]|nr:hypothetical protein [Candidatus Colwellbacteria bacterium]